MARATYVKRARTPNPIVSQEDIDKARRGEDPEAASYYWWKFRHGGKRFSKTRPKASQLTQSSFWSQVYALQEEAFGRTPAREEAETWRDDFADRLEEVGSESRDARDNMPESLQEGSTGELLEQRADSCDEVAGEIRCIDLPDRENEASDEEDAQVLQAFADEVVECLNNVEG